MNYAKIKKYDVANGPGVRVSLFVSGCTHHCKGCFNPETWDFNYGSPFTDETIEQILSMLAPSHIAGLTLLGGEPMEPVNQKGLLPFVKMAKERYPHKSIWCFTGYHFEQDILHNMLLTNPDTKELLSYIDVIVDGEFVLDLKNVNLQFKGSSNQRTILVKESIESSKIVLWEPPTYEY